MKKGTPPKSDPEIDALLGPLRMDEYAGLKASIEMFGQREKGTVWKETGIRLDGRHRQMACAELGKDFQYEVVSFDSRDEAIDWVFNNQFGRRNLERVDRDFLIRKRVEELKARKEATGKLGEVMVHDEPLPPERGPGSESVIKKVAEELKVSPQVVKRAVANAPVLCEKCARTKMPQPGCMKCLEARKLAAKQKPKSPKPIKKGEELVDWKGVEAAIGVIVRLSDRIVAAYPAEKKSMERSEYDRLTAVLVRKKDEWKKKLTGGGK